MPVSGGGASSWGCWNWRRHVCPGANGSGAGAGGTGGGRSACGWRNCRSHVRPGRDGSGTGGAPAAGSGSASTMSATSPALLTPVHVPDSAPPVELAYPTASCSEPDGWMEFASRVYPDRAADWLTPSQHPAEIRNSFDALLE